MLRGSRASALYPSGQSARNVTNRGGAMPLVTAANSLQSRHDALRPQQSLGVGQPGDADGNGNSRGNDLGRLHANAARQREVGEDASPDLVDSCQDSHPQTVPEVKMLQRVSDGNVALARPSPVSRNRGFSFQKCRDRSPSSGKSSSWPCHLDALLS